MTRDKELEKVYKTRFMATQDELKDFTEILQKLIKTNDISLIKGLCSVLHDETNHHEVMFGIIHGIEYLYRGKEVEGLTYLVTEIPQLQETAEEWVEIMHYRILNDKVTREAYSEVLSIVNDQIRSEIVSLLLTIKNEDEAAFGTKVDAVLK